MTLDTDFDALGSGSMATGPRARIGPFWTLSPRNGI